MSFETQLRVLERFANEINAMLYRIPKFIWKIYGK